MKALEADHTHAAGRGYVDTYLQVLFYIIATVSTSYCVVWYHVFHTRTHDLIPTDWHFRHFGINQGYCSVKSRRLALWMQHRKALDSSVSEEPRVLLWAVISTLLCYSPSSFSVCFQCTVRQLSLCFFSSKRAIWWFQFNWYLSRSVRTPSLSESEL